MKRPTKVVGYLKIYVQQVSCGASTHSDKKYLTLFKGFTMSNEGGKEFLRNFFDFF
jgi:hypothetical protein